MRRAILFATLLSITQLAWANPVPRAAGDGLVVEGEVTVIVTKVPFDVVGPAGADVYFWRMPVGWKGTDVGQRLTVTTAPEGTATVSMQSLTIDWNGKKTKTAAYTLAVNVGKATNKPPVDPPPTDPPPLPTGALYFMAVRADGPASYEFSRAMALPEWDALKAQGHRVKDFTATRAKALGARIVVGAPMPCVITLRLSADGKSSSQVRGAVPLPTTGDAVTKLPEGVP